MWYDSAMLRPRVALYRRQTFSLKFNSHAFENSLRVIMLAYGFFSRNQWRW